MTFTPHGGELPPEPRFVDLTHEVEATETVWVRVDHFGRQRVKGRSAFKVEQRWKATGRLLAAAGWSRISRGSAYDYFVPPGEDLPRGARLVATLVVPTRDELLRISDLAREEAQGESLRGRVGRFSFCYWPSEIEPWVPSPPWLSVSCARCNWEWSRHWVESDQPLVETKGLADREAFEHWHPCGSFDAI